MSQDRTPIDFKISNPQPGKWQSTIDRDRQVPWAVWLGANTTTRLAEEWAVDRSTAYSYLERAVARGELVLVRRGRRGSPSRYRVARLLPGMNAGMPRAGRRSIVA